MKTEMTSQFFVKFSSIKIGLSALRLFHAYGQIDGTILTGHLQGCEHCYVVSAIRYMQP
jgi:hypothetical protein